jgi:hypothetical protein
MNRSMKDLAYVAESICGVPFDKNINRQRR